MKVTFASENIELPYEEKCECKEYELKRNCPIIAKRDITKNKIAIIHIASREALPTAT